MNWIYKNNEDNSSRYVLGTAGDKTLICIGVNPSTAEPSALDNTMKSVDRLRKENGYDSWVMLNLYPQRATNPNAMHDVQDDDLVNENLRHIEELFQSNQVEIWAAWGSLIEKRPYLRNCLHQIVELSKKYDCKWYHAGRLLKAGHPHHPLYLRKDEKLKCFDINEYLISDV